MNLFDLPSEKCLIGCCLINLSLKEFLFSKGFDPAWMSPSHAEIMFTIRELEEPSLLSVSRSLSERGRLEHVGGAGKIATCMDAVAGTESEILECSASVRDKARRRELMSMAQEIIESCKGRAKPESIAMAARVSLDSFKSSAPDGGDLVLPAPKFVNSRAPEILWDVKGLIEQGANGFIAGSPKSGKSWLAVDLAICLSTGSRWMGFECQKRKVALISREDAPGLTAWRLRSLCYGRSIMPDSLENLWVNSKAQSPRFRIDNPELLTPMITAIRSRHCQVVILDVMNVLHAADENDATQMRQVMDALTLIHTETGAGLCVLHHFNKAGNGNLTQRLRGSSAIAGWAEYVIAVEHEQDAPRKVSFELKAGESPSPMDFQIYSEGSIAFIEAFEHRTQEGRNNASKVM